MLSHQLVAVGASRAVSIKILPCLWHSYERQSQAFSFFPDFERLCWQRVLQSMAISIRIMILLSRPRGNIATATLVSRNCICGGSDV